MDTNIVSVLTITRAIHQLRAVAEAPAGSAVALYRVDCLTAAHALEDAVRGLDVRVVAPASDAVPA